MRAHAQAPTPAPKSTPKSTPQRQSPLRLGGSRDPLEHEADRLAARLVAGGSLTAGEISGDHSHGAARPSAAGSGAASGPVPAAVHAALARPGTPLPAADREFFEPRLGVDLGDVRLRTGSDADAAARAVDAHAFTVGSDVVFGHSAGSRHTLAHELVHVAQQRSGGRGVLRRQSAPATADAKEETARAAVRFLEELGEQLRTQRDTAKADLGRTPTLDIADRVAERFNQTNVQAALSSGKAVYEAQHLIQQPDAVVVGELRAAYTAFLHTVREAADTALGIAYRARFDVRSREEPRYGETLARWLESTAFRTEMLAGRTAFTPAEAAASTTYEGDLDAVLAKLPYANLADPGTVSRLIDSLGKAQTQVTPGPTGHARPAAVLARAAAARDAVRAVRDTARDGGTVLDAAATALAGWHGDPADPAHAAAGAGLQLYFRTVDPEYARLVVRRLQLMSAELNGGRSLYMHLPYRARGRQEACDVPNVLGESPVPYEIILCRPPSAARQSADTLTLLHELAHAVVPGRGSREKAAYESRPLDRAYAGERLLTRLSTEEALANAESYASLAFLLAGRGGAIKRIPADVAMGCTPDDSGRVLDAAAWSQALMRRALTHIDVWRQEFQQTGAYPDDARAKVTVVFGSAPDDARITAILTDMTTINRSATTWLLGASFTCEPDGSKRCPAGVVGATSDWTVEAASVSKRAKADSAVARSVCPGFHALTVPQQQRVALALMALQMGAIVRPEDILLYAQLAQDIWDIPAPPAAGLADHRAADARAAAAPPAPRPVRVGPNP
ncbi:DUF4157 domain-containing protein [Actinomadura sp. 6N118]|uniref:eCIS core domain-containing protein n=1 Tax=Actinomadura sp. 6N118 TaxID=3375151 RepID=UPI0037939A91